MDLSLRALTAADLPAAYELGRRAFGGDREVPPEALRLRPRRRLLGGFDAAGRLVAKAVDLEQTQWFGGRAVPAAGVAGVAVAPEVRGGGVARQVLTGLLTSARERGAAVSALFPTVAAVYRRLGWERAGALQWYTLPTAALAGVGVPPDLQLRPATVADVPSLHALCTDLASAGNALLGRDGPPIPDTPEAFLEDFDGVTVVERDGRLEGYLTWQRGPGYGPGATLSAAEFKALTPDAATALLAFLGSWSSVVATLRLRLADPDPFWLALPAGTPQVDSVQPWMLRLVDATAAVAARGWPADVAGTVDLDIHDPICPWNAGPHRLVLDAGQGRLQRGGAGTTSVHIGGLSLLYASAAPVGVLRRAGLVSGDTATDRWLDRATAGPHPALLDYF